MSVSKLTMSSILQVVAKDLPVINTLRTVQRLLFLGSTDGTYAACRKELSPAAIALLCQIIQSGKGLTILWQILEIAHSGRATKYEFLLYALALCARFQVRDTQSKKKLPWDTTDPLEKQLPDHMYRDIRPVMENVYQRSLQKIALYCVHKVCITPVHLFTFFNYCKEISVTTGLRKDTKGWGRAVRATVTDWYYSHTPEELAVMVTKYRSRAFFSHRDLFCLSHIHPKKSFPTGHNYWKFCDGYDAIFEYVSKGDYKIRKRRQERLDERAAKRRRMDPEESERAEKQLEELTQERVARRGAIDEVIKKMRIEKVVQDVANSKAIRYLSAFQLLQTLNAAQEDIAARLILEYGFDVEQVPRILFGSKKVWGALLRRMPVKTMLKYFPIISLCGIFSDSLCAQGDESNVFTSLHGALRRINSFFYDNNDGRNNTDFEGDDPVAMLKRMVTGGNAVQASKLNSLELLHYKISYGFGFKHRGQRCWKPVKNIEKAIDYALYDSLTWNAPTKKRFMLAVDISASMDSYLRGTLVACSQIAAALSLQLIEVEELVIPVAFCDEITVLPWTKFMSINECIEVTRALDAGIADCSSPMIWALNNGVKVDVFIIFTDDVIQTENVDPVNAIRKYRHLMGVPDAKVIVIGMTTQSVPFDFSSDENLLFISGMDLKSVPQLILDFAVGFDNAVTPFLGMI